MTRKHAARAEEKQAAFDALVAAGATAAQAVWLSGRDEPNVTVAQLADRRKQWEADLPGTPAVESEPETEDKPEPTK